MNAVTDVVAGHMNAVVIAVAGCVIAVVTAFTLRSPGLRGRCCCGSSHRARGWTDAATFIPHAERPVEALPHTSTRA